MWVPYQNDYLILDCIWLFFITRPTLGLHDTILDWMVKATHVVSKTKTKTSCHSLFTWYYCNILFQSEITKFLAPVQQPRRTCASMACSGLTLSGGILCKQTESHLREVGWTPTEIKVTFWYYGNTSSLSPTDHCFIKFACYGKTHGQQVYLQDVSYRLINGALFPCLEHLQISYIVWRSWNLWSIWIWLPFCW